MKQVKMLLIGLFCATTAHTQSGQVKLYIQQIAANKVLIGYIQKGYTIAKVGLTAIGDIKNGEWNLHADFFERLESINPNIKKFRKVSESFSLYTTIVKSINRAQSQLRTNKELGDAEFQYMSQVYSRFLADAKFNAEEMIKTVTSYEYKMADDERLNKIDQTLHSLKDLHVVAQMFTVEANVLIFQRMQEKLSVDVSRSLYGIK